MHISIKFCLDFFITSRSIHVVLIGFQYIFVSFRILVYFVSLCFVSHFSIFRFVAFRFSFQYISLRFVIFRFVSFRFVRCVSILFRSLVQPVIYLIATNQLHGMNRVFSYMEYLKNCSRRFDQLLYSCTEGFILCRSKNKKLEAELQMRAFKRLKITINDAQCIQRRFRGGVRGVRPPPPNIRKAYMLYNVH